MNAEQIRALQAPLKARYREEPAQARVTLKAQGELGQKVSCSIATGRALVEAGLHPATGGDGTLLCSGDMLLEALVACAGVTLRAVATSLDLDVRGGTVRAEGDLDFRGTLADFSFWRIAPRDARFVAGFGRIHNLSTEQLRHASQ